jgi:hypothetical protein
MVEPEEDPDREPLIYVCRDIEGDHVGGPDCFCNPRGFKLDELPHSLDKSYNLPN